MREVVCGTPPDEAKAKITAETTFYRYDPAGVDRSSTVRRCVLPPYTNLEHLLATGHSASAVTCPSRKKSVRPD